jgi:hypothetical protein
MILRDWRPYRHGNLRGYAVIELSCGLVIDGVAVFRGGAYLPTRPRIEDGRILRVAGEIQYTTDLRWSSRDLRRRWSAAVVELARGEYPEHFR